MFSETLKYFFIFIIALPILFLFIFPDLIFNKDYHLNLIIYLCSILIILIIFYKKKLIIYLNFFLPSIILFLLIHSFLFSKFINDTIEELYKIIIMYLVFLLVIKIKKNFLYFLLIIIFFITSFEGIYQYLIGFNDATEILSKSKLELMLLKKYAEKKNDEATLKYINSKIKEIESALVRLKSNRIFSNFILANAYGGYLILMIPFFHLLIYKNKINIILFIISILLLFLTGSISAILSLTIAYLLFYPAKIKKIIFVIIFLILFSGLLYIRNWNFVKLSIKHHFYNNIISYNIFRDFIFTGIGFGNYKNYYEKYFIEGANEVKYAHNFYLQILVETGIIGFSMFVILFFYYLKFLLKNRNKENIFILIAIFTFLLHNIFDMSFYIISVSIIFVIMNRLYFYET